MIQISHVALRKYHCSAVLFGLFQCTVNAVMCHRSDCEIGFHTFNHMTLIGTHLCCVVCSGLPTQFRGPQKVSKSNP